ncbi:sigma-54-dependent Fis family transcriptional regulator [Pseudogemmobacter bohemicus]|uniref:sigma-54-dependent Fis family transcriptional regulator n=1 Tax=Pseudogemmobacter bohemicus TaxID=2250708 RepID=UPI000DD3B7B2|nr:sigma-54-dependent Fis family transcriptional regulator [Pseudogemmobacter bohemicus]
MQTDIDHIREIEVVSHQGSGTRDPVVVQSWLRCLEKHGLDPATRAEAYILPDAALRRHRQRSEDLIRIARSGIDDLYKLVAGQNYVLLLSDDAGVTVEYLGEEVQKEELRRSGLWLGAEWSEARAGTCALGACIETGEPLIIHQSDHFDVTHGGLSCTAAPIYDTEGRLAAVLDISLLSSPLARASQFLALNLVRQTARRIEMANIMAESREDWVLRLAGSPDFLDVDPQAAIRLDQAGRVIGMTNGAARLMARSLGQDWRRGEALIGRSITDMFNLELGDLEGLTRSHAARDRLLETRDGYRLFAHAIEPRRNSPVAAPALARPQVIPPALRELAGDDPAMRQIAGRAALLAPGRLPILIEGPAGSGKSGLARAIHDAARRGPFITLACDSIAEDEAAILFGRGDPRSYSPGLIDAAEGGTLVLDNPGALPPRLQARLMTLITERSFRPVAALRERASTARVIVTQTDATGLREDLLHRISGTRLSLPPLQARQDLVALAMRIFQRAFGGPVLFDREAVAALTAWSWPGNLGEMTVLAEALAAGCAPKQTGTITLGLAQLPEQFLSGTGSAPDSAAMLAHLLGESGWNVSAVAREMGVDRSTIHRQIRRHGLNRSGSL